MKILDFSYVLNMVLAIIPLILSYGIFILFPKRNALWWLVLVVFYLFLPNAPYVLTDIIHFFNTVRQDPSLSDEFLGFVVMPTYLLYILLGFQCYTVSVGWLCRYLEKQSYGQYCLPIEILTAFLCALGVYLGRFYRFNTTDITKEFFEIIKDAVKAFFQSESLIFVLAMAVTIMLLYFLLKIINQSLLQRYRTQ